MKKHLLCWLLLLSAALSAGEFVSRFGFEAELPDGWQAGLKALADPAWGDLDPARRAELEEELAPADGEVIMTGSPVDGFHHLAIKEEAAQLFDAAGAGDGEVKEKFAAFLTDVPEAELTSRRVAGGVWGEVRVPFEDGTVLVAAYWQMAPERLIVFGLYGVSGEEKRLLEDWELFVDSIHINPSDTGEAVSENDPE